MFVYPTSHELRTIEQVMMPELTLNDPIFDIMPIRTTDNFIVTWEQMDDFDGLQQLRGLDGRPMRVNGTGMQSFNMMPGVYGEFRMLNETELTMRRQFGSVNAPVDIADLVTRAQEQLLQRRVDRIRKIAWDAIQGRFSVAGAGGRIVHVDQFPVSKYAAATPLSNAAASTPLKYFRDVQTFEEGRSASFGAGARAFMNRRTFNLMVANTNNADIAGRRTSGLNTVLNLGEINNVLAGEALPTLSIYNKGYKLAVTSGPNPRLQWYPFIPNNVIIVVADRAGGSVGEYQMVRNATNDGMAPGAYTFVKDEKGPPRTIEVHDGHNGGPALFYPGDVVVMSV